jgi:hypothetical protein
MTGLEVLAVVAWMAGGTVLLCRAITGRWR